MTERNRSEGVWDGQTTRTVRNGRLYTYKELDAELLAGYRELNLGRGLARPTSQVFRLAREQAKSTVHNHIGTADLLVGLLRLPRDGQPALSAFFDAYLPGTQEEQVQKAVTYLTNLREQARQDKSLPALGRLMGISDKVRDGFRIGIDTEHAFRIASTQSGVEGRRIQPRDVLIGIAPVRCASGPILLLDMMIKDKVYYPALYQAYWGAYTEEEIIFYMKKMIADAEADDSDSVYRNVKSPEAATLLSWQLAHKLLNQVRASGQEFNWAFEQAAKQLGIPQEAWDLPLVRRCVGLYNKTKQVYFDIREVRFQYEDSQWQSALGPLPDELEFFKTAETLADALERTLRDGLRVQTSNFSLEDYPQIL